MASQQEQPKLKDRVLGNAHRLQGNLELFAKTWNNSTHVLEAIEAIKMLSGASEDSIRAAIQTLQRSGIVRSLPVRQGAEDLTLEEVFNFCLTWNRASSAASAVKQSGLAPAVAYERANILRRLGVSLDNKPDWSFDTLKVTRTKVWEGNVDQVNEALNEELLVRNGLLRRKEVARKIGSLVRLLIAMRKEEIKTDTQESFVAISESVLRDLGVIA